MLKLLCTHCTGAEGKVEESMELMKEVEDLKSKKRIAEVELLYMCFLRGANDFSVVAMELNTCEEITCNCWNQSSDNHLCLSSAVFKIAKAEVNFEKLLACLVSETSIAICFNLLQFFSILPLYFLCYFQCF